jgi:signal transduction histidine kinase
MLISLFIIAIGALPTVLALNVLRIYRSEVGIGLLLFMLAVSLWQVNIAVLYMAGVFSEETILMLFKLFRAGPTFAVPFLYYIAYLIVKKHIPSIENTVQHRIMRVIFNRTAFVLLIIWSVFVYVVNWTQLGIMGLVEQGIHMMPNTFYFPEYGPLHVLYLIHVLLAIVLLIVIFFVSKWIHNIYLQSFLSTFALCALFLFLTAMVNFNSATGSLIGSLGVIIFTSTIIFSFVRLNNLTTIKYHQLIERQKKLDYSGNVATSLIHEVKNNLQIIKSYSTLLPRNDDLSKVGQDMIRKIQMASNQLEDLTHSYHEYLQKKAINFAYYDLNELLKEAIDITSDITDSKEIEVSADLPFTPLKAYVSGTYLKQVFINLIKNSAESIQSDRLIKKITIQTLIEDDRIIIDFTDTGEGIPSEKREEIFDPFTSSKSDGMGVGLPFSRKLILEHRGKLKVLKSSKEGTTFRIELPHYQYSVI